MFIDMLKEARIKNETDLRVQFDNLYYKKVNSETKALREYLKANFREPNNFYSMVLIFRSKFQDFLVTGTCTYGSRWVLVPYDLPLYARDARLELTIGPSIHAYTAQGYSGPEYSIDPNATVMEQRVTIARALLPLIKKFEEVENMRIETEAKEKRIREEYTKENEERTAANERHKVARESVAKALTKKVLEVKAQLETERTEFLHEYGWPEGRIINCYAIEYSTQYNEDYETVYWFPHYTPMEPLECLRDFIEVERDGKIVMMHIEMPHGYKITKLTWKSIEDVPYKYVNYQGFGMNVRSEEKWVDQYGLEQTEVMEERVILDNTTTPIEFLRHFPRLNT